jgi:hypothetical protein
MRGVVVKDIGRKGDFRTRLCDQITNSSVSNCAICSL